MSETPQKLELTPKEEQFADYGIAKFLCRGSYAQIKAKVIQALDMPNNDSNKGSIGSFLFLQNVLNEVQITNDADFKNQCRKEVAKIANHLIKSGEWIEKNKQKPTSAIESTKENIHIIASKTLGDQLVGANQTPQTPRQKLIEITPSFTEGSLFTSFDQHLIRMKGPQSKIDAKRTKRYLKDS